MSSDSVNPYETPRPADGPPDLRADELAEPAEILDGDRLITIKTFDHAAIAQTARMLLEQQEVRAFLADDNLVGMNWFFSNAVGGVKLQVAARDAVRACSLLEELWSQESVGKASADKITFACEECGAEISFPAHRRGGVETCPRCRKYIDVPE